MLQDRDTYRQFKTKKVSRKVSRIFAKSDLRYWSEKVNFHTPASRTYCVQLQHAGRRARINLGTANRAQAAAEARTLYLDIVALGWDAALRKRNPLDEVEKKVNATIGQYVDAAKLKSAVYAKTLEGYAVALRKIAADICGLADTGEEIADSSRSVARESRRDQAAHIDARKDRELARRVHQAQGRQPAQREERANLGEQLHSARPLAFRARRRVTGARTRRTAGAAAVRGRQGREDQSRALPRHVRHGEPDRERAQRTRCRSP